MPYPPSAYDLHQRQRWTRHDAHLWIRHDAGRFLAPGTDPADVYPTLKQQREAAEDAALVAKIAASRRLLAALRAEVDEMKAALARRRLEEAKYSPSQPRVPAGNPRGGQWSNRNEGGAGSGGDGAEAGSSSDGSGGGGVDASDMSSGTDSESFSDSIVKIAADDSDRRYSVDLREEEVHGHTLADHVGKSDLEIEAEFKRRGYDAPFVSFVPMRLGSFESVESANDLVNRTLERNKATVDMVASGELQDAFVKTRFGFITGREIFRPDPNETYYYFRNTYGVGVYIIHDPSSGRGYRVNTAYPRND
jgi:hypothetical protein